MVEFAFWDIFRNLLLATRWTLLLSVIALIGGAILAFALLILRLINRKTLNFLISIYVEIFQGTPLLMQLFVLLWACIIWI